MSLEELARELEAQPAATILPRLRHLQSVAYSQGHTDGGKGRPGDDEDYDSPTPVRGPGSRADGRDANGFCDTCGSTAAQMHALGCPHYPPGGYPSFVPTRIGRLP